MILNESLNLNLELHNSFSELVRIRIVLGSYCNICATISEPMEPVPPQTSIILS